MIEVIAAHKAGKTIQITAGQPDGDGWVDEMHLKRDGFRFNDFHYRIKPEPPKLTAADYLASHNACGLKVGDKVRVVRGAGERELGWDNDWVREMDSAVGKVVTISEDNGVNGFRFEGRPYEYPHFVLEKVEPKVIWVNLNEEGDKYNPHCGYNSRGVAVGETEADGAIRTAVKFIEVLD